MNSHDSSRVASYINIRLSHFQFSLRNNVFNYRDSSCIFFFNYGSIFYLINVYSDLLQTALKYLKDTEANINNILVITEDFNIRNSIWYPNFLHYSTHSDLLINIADFMNLCLLSSINQFSIRYSDNHNSLNSVIDIICYDVHEN